MLDYVWSVVHYAATRIPKQIQLRFAKDTPMILLETGFDNPQRELKEARILIDMFGCIY